MYHIQEITLTPQRSASLTPDEDREKMLRAQGEFSAEAEIRWEQRIKETKKHIEALNRYRNRALIAYQW